MAAPTDSPDDQPSAHRRTLLGRAILGGAAAVMIGSAAGVPPPTNSTRPPVDPGLHRRASAKRRFFGAAIDSQVLSHDPAYMAQVPHECGIVTPEAAMKWGPVRPTADKFDFSEGDALVAYAGRNNLLVRGHTLLWHAYNPAWLDQDLSPANAEQILSTHVRTVVGHYKQRVAQWDVVNEVLWPRDGKPMGLRDSIWFRALGERMFDIAFAACAEADPASLRMINEFGLDYAWDDDEAKRHAMLDLLAALKARGVPVQGLGMQAHLDASARELDQTVLGKFCDDVASLGLQFVITELDVRDNALPADVTLRDAKIAAHARAYLDVVLSKPACLGVVTWGLSDRRSWLNDDLPRTDGLPQRPLPLDTELRRKAMWTQIAAAFDAAAPRPA